MNYRRICLLFITMLFLLLGTGQATGQQDAPYDPQATYSEAITYQGQLKDINGPVNGTCDLRFTLWDAGISGSQVGSTLFNEGVELVDGLFTARLDFGYGAHTGAARWLEVAVRCPAGNGSYVPLSPRHELTGSPYALSAPWTGLVGVPGDLADGDDDTLYTPGAGLSLSGGQFSVNFAGSGTALTASRSDHHHDAAYVNEGQANSVNSTMIVDSALTFADLNRNGCGTGQIIKWNGSAWACAADKTGTGSYWSLSGNAGTTPGTDYLGTSDNTAMEFKVNNTRALHIEPSSEAPNLIGGWWENYVTAGVRGATIGGGGSGELGQNRVTDDFGTVGGGIVNLAGDNAGTPSDKPGATVGGGMGNIANGSYTTVSGGLYNAIGRVDTATISGGLYNAAFDYGTTIGGGGNNAAGGMYSIISGGENNHTSDIYGTIAGGKNNQAGDKAGTLDDRPHATVGGGYLNTANGASATVSGGSGNTAVSYADTVCGGEQNTAMASYATVGGGNQNLAGNMYSTVGGGSFNTSSLQYATVGGGYGNASGGYAAVVSGGYYNTVTDGYGTVAGGYSNQAGDFAGTPNDHSFATVAGGRDNIASGTSSVVSGGDTNTASGWRSTVPGGVGNVAAGDHSFAAGRRAKALHNGSFVWADANDADFTSDAANQFLVRAYNGVKIVRGSSNYSASQSALQVDQAAAAEAGWFYTSHAGNTFAVLKVAKQPAAPGNFIDGVERTAAGAETRKFHIDKNGAYVAGSDFAEAMPVVGDPASYEPGDVLVISMDQPGAVEKGNQPYDGLVVGVYSTRPGFLGADKGGTTEVAADEVPVAVVGIVPVKVTDENGPIQPGDLLTTSSIPGHAMRCVGLELCFGRTLGKALEELPVGQNSGVIQMLVSLQ